MGMGTWEMGTNGEMGTLWLQKEGEWDWIECGWELNSE
jgi:hypothetical protein